MRCAVPFLMLLIALCSGCARPASDPPPAPAVVSVAQCARPPKPELPPMKGVFLESREGYTLLRVRDARIRAYVAGLEDALNCYEAQLPGDKE
uniref:Uncharacterized protein n=1 Tax=Myoviridae sp. ctrnx29 TaxID=2826704 RepID=A0A8S5LY92_9CAUD|nr:MAG TPA: hypothetical protein [Myoviridae sp. ctrnx29]